MPGKAYNLVVIGAGTAGLVTAAGAAGLGARVALIERNQMGGDCLNFGCVPSKALISSARLAQKMREAARWGLEGVEPKFSFDTVFQRMRALRAGLAPNDSQERFESLGVDVFRGEARFLAPDRIAVNDMTLHGRHFVIATGSRAAMPGVSGLEEAPVFTNETIFDRLERQPRSLLVVGGGPVGCELAQVFGRLGVRVLLVQRGGRLLPREDPDASELLLSNLQAEGVRVVLNARIDRLETVDGETRIFFAPGQQDAAGQGCSPAEVDAILVAAGRKPNVERLNLEAAGVVCDEKGVRVNGWLQTSRPHIFAAGDVAGPYHFTHAADAQARVVVRNTLMPWKALWQKMDYSAVPWCTYTSPEVARVGLNETEAKRLGIACDLYRLPMKEVDRAVLESEESGFAKILTRKGSDRILGATIVGERAGDLLPEFVLAMKRRIGLGALALMIHAYPTRAEIARKLGDRYNRTRLTPGAQKIFAWLYARQTRRWAG